MRTTARWSSALAASALLLTGTTALPAQAAQSAPAAQTAQAARAARAAQAARAPQTMQAAPATTAATAGATAAAQWMAGQLVDGAIPGFAGPDWGLTIDTQWGLIAAEADPTVIAQVVNAVQTHVPDYAGPGWYPDPEARIAGATAKVLLSAVTAGKDVTNFGGRNMRQETLDLIAGQDAGVEQGRLRDKATGGDDTNIFSQSLAVIGLARSGGVPESAVTYLLRQQCSDGYFRMFYNDLKTCDEAGGAPDGDGTAMAVQALMTAQAYGIGGIDQAIARASTWLMSVQKPDGSFGGGVSTEGSNSNSTGLIAQALVGDGRTQQAARATAWVEGMQLTAANAGTGPAVPDIGAIAYNGDSLADGIANGLGIGVDQWRRSTPQAVFALAPIPFADLAWTDPNPPTTPPTVPTPTVTVTATATATATATRTATATVTQRPTSTPTVTKLVPKPGRTTTRTLTAPPLPRATTTRTNTVVVMPTAPALPRQQPQPTVTVTPTPVIPPTTAPTTPPASTQTSSPGADSTATYLQTQLVGANHLEVDRDGKRYVDYDGTVDLGLALRQAGKLPDTLGSITSLITHPDSLAAYTRGAPYEDDQARYAGPLAKTVLLLALTTKDAVGNDLAGELAGRIQPDGRITDQSKLGDQSNLVSQAYGVLALTAVGRGDDAKKARDGLLRQQCGDGSFPAQFGPAEQKCQTGDITSTALALQALNAKHGDADAAAVQVPLSRALKALTDRRDADGAWSGGWQLAGQPNVAATAAAIAALKAAGADTGASQQRLSAAARPDGSFPVQPGGPSDRGATVPAMVASAGGSLLTVDQSVLDRVATAPFTSDQNTKQAAATVDTGLGRWPLWILLALVLVAGGASLGWLMARRRVNQ
ncbi:prenyltransferase/squalene oxidase repeat-containing protein [Kribbella sp. NPDC056861]|uniref:prenyltransferase/squalene oxidase repeat-containing protein n=1 Tax=Kribbella sp. NPDC056861 TaxID=3154857 RepID=UPI003438D504